MGVKDFSFLIKDFSIVKTCQCLVKITLIETWENRGKSSVFHHEEQFVFNDNEKIPVITAKA